MVHIFSFLLSLLWDTIEPFACPDICTRKTVPVVFNRATALIMYKSESILQAGNLTNLGDSGFLNACLFVPLPFANCQKHKSCQHSYSRGGVGRVILYYLRPENSETNLSTCNQTWYLVVTIWRRPPLIEKQLPCCCLLSGRTVKNAFLILLYWKI